MDHSVIFLWVLLSAAASQTTRTYEIPPTTNYPCGQAFSDSSRSFNGPYYDGGRNVLECLWTIESKDNLPIKAIIDYIELDCDREYISIYNGEAHRSRLLGKICSGSSRTFVSFSGTMSVLLHRNSDFTGPGFFAYYDIGELETTTVPGIPELETTTVPKFTAKETRSSTAIPWSTHAPESFTSGFHCGGLLTDPTGYIYGPYYPGNGASMECIWEIQTTSYSHIELDFYYVSSNLNCRTGYVEVYDGALGSRKLGRVCSGSRFVYISTSNRITIVLYRNSYQAGDAFNAYYYSFTAATSSEPMRTTATSPEPMLNNITSSEPMRTSGASFSESMETSSASSSEPMRTSGAQPAVPETTPMEEKNTTQPAVPETTPMEEKNTTAQPAVPETTPMEGNYSPSSSEPTRTSGEAQPAVPETTPMEENYTTLSQEPTTGFLPDERTTRKQTTTPTSGPATVAQCGGTMSNPSGYFSGPYYSGNNITEQCVWEITVDPFHYIVLRFSMISLDCSTEYVEILDGGLNSPFVLGKMCSGIYSNYTYTSTSNTMTILLHRDSDLYGYGFGAYYNSIQETLTTTTLPVQNETTETLTTTTLPIHNEPTALSCSGDFMSAHISRHYLQLKGYNAWEVYLNSSDSRCRPQITREYVVFNIPYSGCGTKRQESNNDTIVYSNNIKTSPFDEDNIITRKTDMIFHIKCEMNENIMVETMFVVKNSVDITEKHHGHYEMTLGCYESASFSHKVYGFPYYVSMDQELFFEVILNNSDPNLILFLDTCKASPYAHDFENLTYPLIEHGCVRDSTYKNLPSPNKNTARFSFNSFKFVDQHNEIFLQCKLVVCMANDYSSRCYQGCLSRKKRNVDEDQSKVDVVVGPFKLQEKFQEDKRQELVKNVNPGKDEAFSPLTVATVVLAAMVFVLSGFLLNSRLRRRKYQQIY